MSETSDQHEAIRGGVGDGEGRRYTRTQVVASGAVLLAVGATAGWLVPKALEQRRAAASFSPAAVATRLGNACLRLKDPVTKETGDKVVKKVGSGTTCEVDWTRGRLSGVVISVTYAQNGGKQEYAVGLPSYEQPAPWTWSIGGNLGSSKSPTAIIQADTPASVTSLDYEVYGCGSAGNDCNIATTAGPGEAGAAEIAKGLLAEINYLGMNALRHSGKSS